MLSVARGSGQIHIFGVSVFDGAKPAAAYRNAAVVLQIQNRVGKAADFVKINNDAAGAGHEARLLT